MSQRRQTMLILIKRRPGLATRPRLINRVCVHLVEIYFSIIQRKVLTPNDCTSLQELEHRIIEFGRRYSALGKPFAWSFSRQELERRLRHPLLQSEVVTLAKVA